MDEKQVQEHLEKGRNFVVDLLQHKTGLKLDTYENTRAWFKIIKEELKNCVDLIREGVTDERIRLHIVDKGNTEAQLFIGSDVLVFSMHTNIFQLSKNDYASKTSYVKANPANAYCGIINIYNFLADSYEFNRSHDVGYLIGRLFINHENHFMMEGKGHLNMLYRDFMHQTINPLAIRDIIIRACIHAINFDLYTPPYRNVQKATVQDLNKIAQSAKLKTGKRLGFKFESEQNIQ